MNPSIYLFFLPYCWQTFKDISQNKKLLSTALEILISTLIRCSIPAFLYLPNILIFFLLYWKLCANFCVCILIFLRYKQRVASIMLNRCLICFLCALSQTLTVKRLCRYSVPLVWLPLRWSFYVFMCSQACFNLLFSLLHSACISFKLGHFNRYLYIDLCFNSTQSHMYVCVCMQHCWIIFLFSFSATPARNAADGQPTIRHHQRRLGDGWRAARPDWWKCEG